MRLRILLLAAVPAVALAVLVYGMSYQEDMMYISYDDGDAIRQDLEAAGIMMSSAVTLYDNEAVGYCSFLANDSQPISYCMSTELEVDGEFLGNVHMAGTAAKPVLALGVMQSDGAVSQRDQIAALVDSMLRHTACDVQSGAGQIQGGCPYGSFPDGLDSAESWINHMIQRHAEGDGINTRSAVDGLPVSVLLEVTGNDDGHLWKILVGPVS